MPKKKRGILRILFSRIGLVLVLMGVQVFLIVSAYQWFDGYFQWFNGLIWLITIAMVFELFSSDMDATGKLTWLLLMSLVPVPAALFYLFTERDVGHRAIKARIKDLIAETKDLLPQDPVTFQKQELVSSATDDLCTYLNRSGCFPIYEHTAVTYLSSGEEKLSALLEELQKARKFIFMEYFIISEGYFWGKILKILAEKAAQGVDVRIVYDGMCEIALLSSDYPNRLAKLGIKCKPFSPIHPFLSTHYNYRDHRKILVIDGKVAFNGGINLSDEYVNLIHPFGTWKDAAVMLKGPAVQSFTLTFLQTWNITEADPKWDEALITPDYQTTNSDFDSEHLASAESHNDSKRPSWARSPSGNPGGFVMPYSDCPLDEYKVGENVYMDILNRAKTYVHVMTPYLILDNELEQSLKFAAERGVDVKLILPGIPDKKSAYSLAKSHYRYLIDAGIKIYEYTPGFVHAKVFVSDNEKAVVGTINLDYRSLYHHFECATYLFRTPCISDIESDFQATLAQCREVTRETIAHERLSYRILGRLLKFVAPLM
ncbi:MAG: cardiolipin synthase [Lachnospiraceae bacterium]|nr:cardiolipin synthase [Lachnospiraceae bacterium]